MSAMWLATAFIHRCAALLLIGIVLAAPTPAHRPNAGTDAAPTFALAELRARAEQEHATAAPRADVPLPQALRGFSVSLEPAAREQASAPLDELLATFGERRRVAREIQALEAAVAEASDEAKLDATRLYARGRLARLEGRVRESVALLRRAASLDPSSGDVWRELGFAERRAGNVPASRAAFERADHRLGPDPVVLEQLAVAALERREFERAAEILAEMRTADLEAVDPALPAITDALLADALTELGHLAAASDAMRAALERPERLSPATDRHIALAAVYRNRADAWVRVGDAELRLGDIPAAAASYRRAIRSPGARADAILPRLVYALLRIGHPHAAALATLRVFEDASGQVGQPTIELVSYVTENGADPHLVDASLAAIANQATGPRAVLLTPAIALARATLAEPARAIHQLSTAARTFPANRSIRERLLDLAVAQGKPSTLDAIRLLLDTEPRPLEPLLWSLRARFDADRLAALLAESAASNTAFATLAAWNAFHNRQLERGLADALTAASGANDPAAWLAAGRMALRLGRTDTASRAADALALLAANPDAGAAYLALAHLEHDRGRTASARRSIDTLLVTDLPAPIRVEALVMAARIAAESGDAEHAITQLEAALEIDPARERTHAALINALQAHRPDQLPHAFDRVRRWLPDGQVLRAVRIREALESGQISLAQRILDRVLREQPHQPEWIEGQTAVLLALKRPGALLAWVDQQQEAAPSVAAYAIARARALVALGQANAAVDTLRAWLERLPGDTRVSLEAESILRDALGDPAAAAELALDRLATQHGTPARRVERAAALLELNRSAESLLAIEDALDDLAGPDADQLEPPHARTLRARTAALLLRIATNEHDLLARAAEVQRRAVGHLDDLTTAVFADLAELQLAAGTDVEALIEHADRLTPVVPDASPEYFQAIIEAITNRESLPSTRRPRINLDRDQVLMRACAAAARRTEVNRTVFITQWITLATRDDDADEIFAGFQLAEEVDAFQDVLASMSFGRDLPDAPDERNAELAARAHYFAAAEFQPLDHDEAYIWMMKRIINLAPLSEQSSPEQKEAFAQYANSLGYTLLEAEHQLAYAAHLIAAAYTLAPDQGHIVDSWGWLLYRAGVFEDELDEQGELVRAGAISVLQESERILRAEEGGEEGVIAVILDHLGDAQWRAGETDAAVRTWHQAVDITTRASRSFDQRNIEPSDPLRREVELAGSNSRAKINAAGQPGAEVPIARLYPGLTGPAVPDGPAVVREIMRTGGLDSTPDGGI